MNLFNLHTNPEELLWYEEDSVMPLLSIIDNELNTQDEFMEGNIMVEIQEVPIDIQTSPIIKNKIIDIVQTGQSSEYLIVLYVEEILKERWPEVEEILKDQGYAWEEYKEILGIKG